MGLTLFWGMKRDGLNYTDGHVLDPRDGSVYHAKMWLDEDGKMLHVRGYLGIPMLGKTQDWRRLPDDAMKAEDVPPEILANGEVSPSDKAAKAEARRRREAETQEDEIRQERKAEAVEDRQRRGGQRR